jgi:hypothetical protein
MSGIQDFSLPRRFFIYNESHVQELTMSNRPSKSYAIGLSKPVSVSTSGLTLGKRTVFVAKALTVAQKGGIARAAVIAPARALSRNAREPRRQFLLQSSTTRYSRAQSCRREPHLRSPSGPKRAADSLHVVFRIGLHRALHCRRLLRKPQRILHHRSVL